jgi:hypothetical protein
MSSALIYPERRRCLACRCFFGFIVLKGLYCSYECAGVPAPRRGVWSRSCYTPISTRNRKPPKRKQAFFSRQEAEASPGFLEDPLIDVYECPNCLMYHLGHNWKRINQESLREAREQRQGRGRVLIGAGEPCS